MIQKFEEKFSTHSGSGKRAVVVVSLDGVGMEQLNRIDPKFVEKYSVTKLEPDEISLTFPGHATLATGVTSELHKVKQNHPLPEEIPFAEYNSKNVTKYMGHANRMKVPPVWLFAKQKGMEVNLYQWPMNLNKWCGYQIKDNPDVSFDKSSVTIDQTINAVLAKLISWDMKNDLLMYAYSTGLDIIGHEEGPYSEKTKKVWEKNKPSIEGLISSVKKASEDSGVQISLYFVSDHGMYDKYATQAVDLYGLLNYVEINPEPNLLTKLRRLWMIKDKDYTDEQLVELGKYFLITQGPQTAFRIKIDIEENSTPFVLNFENADCKSSDSTLKFLGKECHAHDGGHHERAGAISPVELDGVYFSVNPISETIRPSKQQEFVPMLSKDLNIDLSSQMNFESCDIENLETQH